MLRWIAVLLLLLLPSWASAQRPEAVVPTRDDTVLERLPRGYAALMPRRGAATPNDSLAQAGQLLSTAASTGDARLAARAESLLARFPESDQSPTVIRARAYAAQHRHDFVAAVALLDKLISSSPRDADARLARAQILLVQGHLDRARSDCAGLAFGVDAGSALLCIAALSTRLGDTEAAIGLLERWLAQPDTNKDARRRYALVMRAEAASQADADDADTWFQRALALAPDDVRTLAAYSRHLRRGRRSQQVLQLLAGAPVTDGLQLERALALHATNNPSARSAIDAQARVYRLSRAMGTEPELRDEAEFLLTLRGDATAALAVAQRNFLAQRDIEDVDLLRRAAVAAQQPQALRPLQEWARSQHLLLPPLRSGSR